MPTSGVDIIEHLKSFLNLAPRMKRVYKKAVEDRRGTFTTLFFQLMDYCIKTFSSTWLSNLLIFITMKSNLREKKKKNGEKK